nr:long-chain fatty acid--CoA ligase [uncultured Desulfobacter sp.]
MPFKTYSNVYQMLCDTVQKYPEQPAYRWFEENNEEKSVTWQQYNDQVKDVAKSLIALGLKKDDKFNIISYSSYPWVLTDMAGMSIGAVTVGIYQSNLPKDCAFIINHCDSVLIFAENDEQLAKLMEIRDQIPNVRKVVMFNGADSNDEWVISYETFLKFGKDISDEVFDMRCQAVMADDTAGIIYTSGTTGIPKGAVITHDNICFTAQSVLDATKIIDGWDMFLFLPLAHVFARTCVNTAMFTGCRTTFARSIKTLVEDFKVAAPHWFVSVPRIFEKIHTKVISDVEAKGGMTEKIFNWACTVGSQVSRCKVKKQDIPLGLGLQYNLAKKLVFSKIDKALGGNVQWCICGAAPLNPDIARFFHAAGILILEGLGMTEDTSFSHVNRPDNYNFGAVGPPGPGVEHKLDEDGEVLLYGRSVMKAYYKMPQETFDSFSQDGWLKTGDLGEIDENNVLKITGRKKDLIITSGGKNIAPSAIERLMGSSKYIHQICVVGEKRKYLSAVVTLDKENITDYAKAQGIGYSMYENLFTNEKVVALINEEVANKNKSLPSFEALKQVTIVPEFTIDNDMMTPTFKIKKNIIMDRYKDEIEKMYM